MGVTRENIVQDTIIQLQNSNTTDLKKPLRVKFAEEEAEDAGGVTKEFFMLLIKEILNPDYGMFKEYEESNAMWFNCQILPSSPLPLPDPSSSSLTIRSRTLRRSSLLTSLSVKVNSGRALTSH